jgi:diacylglycerol diphosphate phosphatase/phosphatidate phosphatase
MRLFNRRNGPIAPNTATATGAPASRTSATMDKPGHHHYGHNRGGLNARPTAGEWLRGTALDLITMFILGAIGLGVRQS